MFVPCREEVPCFGGRRLRPSARGGCSCGQVRARWRSSSACWHGIPHVLISTPSQEPQVGTETPPCCPRFADYPKQASKHPSHQLPHCTFTSNPYTYLVPVQHSTVHGSVCPLFASAPTATQALLCDGHLGSLLHRDHLHQLNRCRSSRPTGSPGVRRQVAVLLVVVVHPQSARLALLQPSRRSMCASRNPSNTSPAQPPSPSGPSLRGLPPSRARR